MGRILAIDYGRKRCGVAVTDILKISANGLPTLRTCDLEKFLTDYCAREDVERIIIGHPLQNNGEDSESMRYIRPFMNRLARLMPDMPVEEVDERFTSVMAHRAMLEGGLRKSARADKGLADKMAATIILTSWLESNSQTFKI